MLRQRVQTPPTPCSEHISSWSRITSSRSIGGLGTEPQLAVRDYLNQQKVPQVYVSTGATTFGAGVAKYPWTIGWQPDYQAEGAIYGKYIAANEPNAKIGVLFQNDDYGKDYLTRFPAGLGSKKSQSSTRPATT